MDTAKIVSLRVGMPRTFGVRAPWIRWNGHGEAGFLKRKWTNPFGLEGQTLWAMGRPI